jgi:hypothetical protein
LKRLLAGLLCLALLAGCGAVQRNNPFVRAVPEEPLPFRAKLSADRGSPGFSVAVDTRGSGIDQWRESARYPGTQFCIRRFGTSDIVWQHAGGDWAMLQSGGDVVVRGRCDVR